MAGSLDSTFIVLFSVSNSWVDNIILTNFIYKSSINQGQTILGDKDAIFLVQTSDVVWLLSRYL